MSDVTDHNPGWPPELRAALMEFDAWSKAQLLKVEQAESTPAGPLYHYTGEASLRGILTRQRLWCFSHLHQKDPTEFEYALMIARRVIKEVGVRIANGLDGREANNGTLPADAGAWIKKRPNRPARWLSRVLLRTGYDAVQVAPTITPFFKPVLSTAMS